MRTTIVGLCLTLGILIQTVDFSAAREPGAFLVGMGADSCGQIGKQYRENPNRTDALMLYWAQGFMSALSTIGSNFNGTGPYRQLDALSIDTQLQTLRAYCDQHPLAIFADAVNELYKKFPLTEAPPATGSSSK